ncbi:hypothetical protein ACFL2Q_16930 [Thermodesulfobacteriota bacterium]
MQKHRPTFFSKSVPYGALAFVLALMISLPAANAIGADSSRGLAAGSVFGSKGKKWVKQKRRLTKKGYKCLGRVVVKEMKDGKLTVWAGPKPMEITLQNKSLRVLDENLNELSSYEVKAGATVLVCVKRNQMTILVFKKKKGRKHAE